MTENEAKFVTKPSPSQILTQHKPLPIRHDKTTITNFMFQNFNHIWIFPMVSQPVLYPEMIKIQLKGKSLLMGHVAVTLYAVLKVQSQCDGMRIVKCGSDGN
jgi:hypothetical protein